MTIGRIAVIILRIGAWLILAAGLVLAGISSLFWAWLIPAESLYAPGPLIWSGIGCVAFLGVIGWVLCLSVASLLTHTHDE